MFPSSDRDKVLRSTSFITSCRMAVPEAENVGSLVLTSLGQVPTVTSSVSCIISLESQVSHAWKRQSNLFPVSFKCLENARRGDLAFEFTSSLLPVP